jgi:hypothetical protein
MPACMPGGGGGEEPNIYEVGSESTDDGRFAKLSECFSLMTVCCRKRFSMKNQGKLFIVIFIVMFP